MPFVGVETNVPDAEITSELLSALSRQVADSLGKSEKYLQVCARGGAKLIFGGTDEPAAMVKVLSIGRLGAVENKRHSKIIFNILEKFLKISPSRVYIHFVDVPGQDLGYNGGTVA